MSRLTAAVSKTMKKTDSVSEKSIDTSLLSSLIKAKSFGEIKEIIQNRKKTAETSGKEEKAVFSKPPVLLEIPPYTGDGVLIEQYWLSAPYAYINIFRGKDSGVYAQIIEPKLTEKELIVLEETFEQFRGQLVYDTVKRRGEFKIEDADFIETILKFDPDITPERTYILIYYLRRNFFGYGKLDAILQDEQIEDITCNGADIPVYLYHRKYANIETDCVFSADELNKYVLKLAQKADKQLSLTSPLVDAALPGGSRAQITYSDIISAKGSSFTIRKFKSEPMTPGDLVASNTYSAEVMAHIWLAVENRKSMIIAGGTASGKTSTMNAASFFIPYKSKIVSIEDTREIQLPHTNWLPMKTRESIANITGAGNVSMFSLLKAALRQRPEYIIVGEVRGEEAQTLFQAMNTGHTTYSTLHAGNVKEAVNRLINDPINVPEAMFGALNLVVVQSLLYADGKGFRRCLSLNEIVMDDDDKVTWRPLFVWNNMTDTFDKVYTHSAVFDSIAYQNGWSEDEVKKRLETRRISLQQMAESGNTRPQTVESAILQTELLERRGI